MSIKGKTAVKLAAKTGGKAVPGLGQAIMVIEGTPVAVEETSRAYQILAEGKKKSDELRKAGKYLQATKVLYQAQIEAQKAAAVGISRTAITALVAREAADSVLKRNPNRLDWRLTGSGLHVAQIRSLGFRIIIVPKNLSSYRYSVLVVDDTKSEKSEASSWWGMTGTLQDVKLSVDDWLTENYPLWALGQLAKENPMKPRSRRPWPTRRNPMMSEVELYQDILAHLRALQWVSWTSHWTASGPSYYSDHRLLQRLYTGKGGPDINEEIDALGERMVAYFGPPSVDPEAIVGRVHQLTGQAVKSSADQFEALLTMEMQLQQAIRRAWEANQASGEHMSLGIDDLLMSLANEREGAIYLLRRRLGGRKPLSGTVSAPPAMIAPPAVPVSFRTVEPQDESLTPQPLDMSFRPWSKQAAANPALPPGFSLERGVRGGRPVFRIFRMGMDTGKYALRGERAVELAYKMARRA